MNNNSNKEIKKWLTFEEIKAVDCKVDEQETSVAFYRGDKIIKWFTSDNEMVTEFKHKVKSYPGVYNMYVSSYTDKGKPAGYFIEMPLELLSFRGKKKEVSDEQRALLADRLSTLRQKKKLKQQEQ